jgi:hypothetical protein
MYWLRDAECDKEFLPLLEANSLALAPLTRRTTSHLLESMCKVTCA